jgi:hypothetical protein
MRGTVRVGGILSQDRALEVGEQIFGQLLQRDLAAGQPGPGAVTHQESDGDQGGAVVSPAAHGRGDLDAPQPGRGLARGHGVHRCRRAALELTEQGTRIADAVGGVTDKAWANAAKHYDENSSPPWCAPSPSSTPSTAGTSSSSSPQATTSPASSHNQECLAGTVGAPAALSITHKAIGFDSLDLPPPGRFPWACRGCSATAAPETGRHPGIPSALLHPDVRLIWHAHPGTDSAARPTGPPGFT